MPAKPSVIADPLTNRGTAFTAEERRQLTEMLGRVTALLRGDLSAE